MTEEPPQPETPTSPPEWEEPAFSRWEDIDLNRYVVLRTAVLKGRRLTVFIDKPKLSAWVLYQPSAKKVELSDDDVVRMLNLTNIAPSQEGLQRIAELVAGVKRKAKDPELCTPILVARGKRAADGKDSFTTWHTEDPTGAKREGRDAEDKQSVDHRAAKQLVLVKKGDLICEVTPPTPGVAGTDVYGRVVEPYNGEWKRLLAGDFIETNQSHTRMTAERDGYLQVRDGYVHVAPVLIVTDVNYRTGNIEFDGDAIVDGEVAPGFSVSATNLRVRTVNQGRIHTLRDLNVEQNLFGGESLPNIVEGSARIQKMRNAELLVDGDVTCHSEAVACDVHTAGRFLGRNCTWVGGGLHAVEGILLAEAGNSEGARQNLIIDPEQLRAPCVLTVRKELEACRARIEHIATKIGPLLQNPEALAALTAQQRAAVMQLKSRLGTEKKSLDAAKLAYDETVEPLKKRARHIVAVRRTVWPGTRIRLGEAELVVNEPVQGPVRFRLSTSGTEIVQEAFEDKDETVSPV